MSHKTTEGLLLLLTSPAGIEGILLAGFKSDRRQVCPITFQVWKNVRQVDELDSYLKHVLWHVG